MSISSSPSTTTHDEGASSVATRTSEAASTVVSSAKDESRALLDEVRQRARQESDSQTERVASGLHGFARQLTDMAESSSEQTQGAPRLVHEAGQRIDRIADRVEEGGVDGLTEDAKRFAASRPLAYIGLAAGAGFVVGRFLRNADIGALVHAAQDSTNSREHASGEMGADDATPTDEGAADSDLADSGLASSGPSGSGLSGSGLPDSGLGARSTTGGLQP